MASVAYSGFDRKLFSISGRLQPSKEARAPALQTWRVQLDAQERLQRREQRPQRAGQPEDVGLGPIGLARRRRQQIQLREGEKSGTCFFVCVKNGSSSNLKVIQFRVQKIFQNLSFHCSTNRTFQLNVRAIILYSFKYWTTFKIAPSAFICKSGTWTCVYRS